MKNYGNETEEIIDNLFEVDKIMSLLKLIMMLKVLRR